jgi:hypothetical protein
MKHDPGEPRLPDVVLERFRLNELPADLACLVEARIANDEHLQRRLDALRRSDDDIRVSYPGERFAETIRTRLDGRERARSPAPRRAAMYWIVPLTVAAATVALVLVIARTTSPPLPGFGHTRTGPTDMDRIKGLAPALRVYRKTSTSTEMLADGAFAHEGDVVRVGYEAAGRPYGLILSIDGRGGVTRHLPTTGDLAARLEPSSTVLLDQSYELDDAPRWERFFFITGMSRFALAPVLEAAEQASANRRDRPATDLALPYGLEQSIFSLQKEDTP